MGRLLLFSLLGAAAQVGKARGEAAAPLDPFRLLLQRARAELAGARAAVTP